MIAQLFKYLYSIGFFSYFLIFLLAFTIIFAFLRRSKIIDNIIANAIVSFSIAFLVSFYPLIAGIDISVYLSVFFTQAFIFILLFLISFITASLFYPDFIERLKTFFVTRGVLMGSIVLFVALLVTSGTLSILFTSAPTVKPTEVLVTQPQPKVPKEVTTLMVLITSLIVFAAIIVLFSYALK